MINKPFLHKHLSFITNWAFYTSSFTKEVIMFLFMSSIKKWARGHHLLFSSKMCSDKSFQMIKFCFIIRMFATVINCSKQIHVLIIHIGILNIETYIPNIGAWYSAHLFALYIQSTFLSSCAISHCLWRYLVKEESKLKLKLLFFDHKFK